MALDFALSEMVLALSTSPLAIVERLADTHLFQERNRLESLLAHMNNLLKKLEEGFKRNHEVFWSIMIFVDDRPENIIEILDDLIMVSDERIEFHEKMFKRFRKTIKRARRQSGRLNALADLDERLFAIIGKEIDMRVDVSSELRAMRAEVNPESRGGPTFDKPGDLASYLLS
ncbi:hypothetical protein [Methylobacterium sp. E-045]|uniref:hypothetical protein n=1 Tax=Methylobacterium sp. E-045 TaxID=2836575 RepID=UPI001FB90884|nr:hypothetical protein [Methylobacterium sp. E-045]